MKVIISDVNNFRHKYESVCNSDYQFCMYDYYEPRTTWPIDLVVRLTDLGTRINGGGGGG